jgi:hypothetical protein
VTEVAYVARLWQDGERRLRDLGPVERQRVDPVVDAIADELRRRLGGRFTAAELAGLYDGAERWTMTLAVRLAPEEPLAWEQWVADAAFNRYVRDSVDWPLV